MKIKRYKKAERYMTLYKNNFGFREPYQVLLDGTFCQVALEHKVNLQDQLPRYLSGECKLLTTACVIEETRRLGKPLHGAYLILSQFPVHNCGHEKPISANKCLSSFIIDTRNRDHYLVATQDHRLRVKITKSAVCPIIKLANNAFVLDKPTERVKNKVARTHHYLANKISDEEIENVIQLKREANLEGPKEESEKRRKRKGPRGPNPMSCKKKQKKVSSNTSGQTNSGEKNEPTKKRHRKKVHLARHVKKFLQEELLKYTTTPTISSDNC